MARCVHGQATITVDDALQLHAGAWRLAAVVVHRGASMHGWRYVACVRHGPSYILYDDACVARRTLHGEVHMDAVMCFCAPHPGNADAMNAGRDDDFGDPGDGRGDALM